MTQFNYDLIMQPNTVVHCDTEEKDRELSIWADSKGLRWGSGKDYLKYNNWHVYKKDTCYYLYAGEFSDVDFYKEEDYTILKYEDVVLNENVTDNKVKNPNVSHYDIWQGFEAIDVMKAILTKDEYVGYLKGNILKYQLRLGKKDDVSKEIVKIKDYQRELNSILGA